MASVRFTLSVPCFVLSPAQVRERILATTELSPAPRESRMPYLQRSMRLFVNMISKDSRVARPASCPWTPEFAKNFQVGIARNESRNGRGVGWLP